MLATTPNELLKDGIGERQSLEPSSYDRMLAASKALRIDDLERVTIMVEALAAKRTSHKAFISVGHTAGAKPPGRRAILR